MVHINFSLSLVKAPMGSVQAPLMEHLLTMTYFTIGLAEVLQGVIVKGLDVASGMDGVLVEFIVLKD